jgi:hypothetical protein
MKRPLGAMGAASSTVFLARAPLLRHPKIPGILNATVAQCIGSIPHDATCNVTF